MVDDCNRHRQGSVTTLARTLPEYYILSPLHNTHFQFDKTVLLVTNGATLGLHKLIVAILSLASH